MKRRRHAHLPPCRSHTATPVLYGFDAEFGNSVIGLEYVRCTSGEAARALLAEISGYPSDGFRNEWYPWWAWNEHGERCIPTEYGRKYQTNGDCVYVDMEHLEICLAERLDCFQFPAALHAAIARVEHARQMANAKLPAGREIVVFANNSDGQGNSYGSHMNFLLPRTPRALWDDIFHLKSLYLPYLASLQAAMVVLTGQGKVGSENGQAPVDYQIAQRPDFFVTLSSLETTSRRGLVNSRRESLCGPEHVRRGLAYPSPEQLYACFAQKEPDLFSPRYDRLHVIFFDWNLMPVAAILKCGVMQLVLAGMQRGLVKPGLILDSPVDAAVRFSHDPNLGAKALTVDGRELTAVELLSYFAEEVAPLVRAGELDEIVPRAADILRLLEDTLAKLRARDFVALAARLDWVLKRVLLQQELDRAPHLNWRSPEIKHLDQMYSSTGPDGLFNACARAGLIERLPTPSAITRAQIHPPEDTRAWTRGHLLRTAGRWAVQINWDAVAFQAWEDPMTCRYWRVDLSDPLGFTRREAEPIFQQASNLDELFRGLNQLRAAPAEPAEAHDGNAERSDNRPSVCDQPEPGGTERQADPCSTTFNVGGDYHA
ncbi:MAG TPA: proteasome accessory factor PafA2 family protein [Phycisphaerae bacterium]|nr:proteasome accessory factor PafA2 family protein [Phycisphaerae bacterium]HOJ54139.1 proteasome accessory factor PafA2 family protein [Phycisphaerae bacterium]HOL25568.1 proteasome accessory factor PafA2 family protein [Phycisphaerae bacterium]HPP20999.1 proteasome accessory factor PafA2 family protein [Phycisphaerae bacterium]HPU31898.1 proteasome accessory factor PafA2 family protein [Phycisphaerae bacterium]